MERVGTFRVEKKVKEEKSIIKDITRKYENE